MENNLNKNFSAFTLVELLATITVVGVLSAISIAAFNEYRKAAYSAQTDIAYRNMMTALIASEGELNQIGCINKNIPCENILYNSPYDDSFASENHNAHKNYLIDYLPDQLKSKNKDFFYYMRIEKPGYSIFESRIQLVVAHCKSNRGYLYSRRQGQESATGIVETNIKAPINEIWSFFNRNYCNQ